MIVVTTPTGHIGSQVLAKLMETSEKLRVIARHPSKLSDHVKQRVQVVEGSMDDADTMNRACQDADQLFFVIPPSHQCTDVNEYYLNFARIASEAIENQNGMRVVFISGTGLGHEKNAGPVSASFWVEKEIEKLNAASMILHCGTFMENLIHSIPSIKSNQMIGTPVPGDIKCPWVATQDIAHVAVRLLLDPTWTRKGSVGVLGPKDISYNEIAKILSDVLGQNIGYQQISDDLLKSKMMEFGASDAAARGLVEIYASMTNGTFNLVRRTPQSSTPTSFYKWCENVFKPIFLSA